MKQLVIFAAALLAMRTFAVVEIGESVPNLCYNDINQQKFCLNDFKGQVLVLVYNAGWCGPCNEEMGELAPASLEFANKPVTFISLSGAGWSQGSLPNQSFLNSWKSTHQIPDKDTSGVSFIVASAPGDFGKNFITPPLYIPNAAVVDQQGVLFNKGVGLSSDQLLSDVRQLLNNQ